MLSVTGRDPLQSKADGHSKQPVVRVSQHCAAVDTAVSRCMPTSPGEYMVQFFPCLPIVANPCHAMNGLVRVEGTLGP